MKYLYTFSLFLFLSAFFDIRIYANDNDTEKNRVQDNSDNKYLSNLLEKILYNNIFIDNESDRRNYSNIQSSNIINTNSSYFPNDSVKYYFYEALMKDIDLYQKLGVTLQEYILHRILASDSNPKNSNTQYYMQNSKIRAEIIKTNFINIIEPQFIIDAENSTYYLKTDSLLKYKLSINDLDSIFSNSNNNK